MCKFNEEMIKLFNDVSGQSAIWYGLIYKEMLEAGVENAKEICSRAYREYGRINGRERKAAYKPNDSFEVKASKICPEDIGKYAYEVDVETGDNTIVCTGHTCVLVDTWKKLGFSDAMCIDLCDIAMEGDRGVAEVNDLAFDLEKSIARGDTTCRFVYKNQ